MNFFLRWITFWFPMVLIAVINGAIRDLGYAKFTGELAAHQISTVILLVLFGLYMQFVFKKQPVTSAVQSLQVGLLWLLLTLAFEFGLGYTSGKTMTEMLRDYRIGDGRIWILVLVWVALAPYWFFTKKSLQD